MICVRRDRRASSGIVICPDDSWTELARHALAVALREASGHEARRSVYAHDSVKEALEKLFHGKCAYCETKITGGFDWNVEHFRPKKRVAERADHPGYYWLAYEWTNLYPSCQHCNQIRHDRSPQKDPSRKRLGNPAGKGGKADQFPLMEEGERAMSPTDDLTLERPLLLDPCQDGPDQLLSFNSLGEIIAMGDDPRSQATIDVFHLNREPLSDRRQSVVEELIEALVILNSRKKEISPAVRNDFLVWLQQRWLNDSCEYAGVGRAIQRNPAAFGLSPEDVAELGK